MSPDKEREKAEQQSKMIHARLTLERMKPAPAINEFGPIVFPNK